MEINADKLEADNERLKEENKILRNADNDTGTDAYYILENKRLNDELDALRSKKYGGYIYVLYNDMFRHYGENVYKIGCSKQPTVRLLDYTTSYKDPSVIKYTSSKFNNKLKAEKYLFKLIDEYRMESNREFFELSLNEIIENIQLTENNVK
jgi:hypothetical protein